jgi:hypothetical protein
MSIAKLRVKTSEDVDCKAACVKTSEDVDCKAVCVKTSEDVDCKAACVKTSDEDVDCKAGERTVTGAGFINTFWGEITKLRV